MLSHPHTAISLRNYDTIDLYKKKVDVIHIETTHLGRVSIGTGEGQRTDYKAIEKALAPAFVHSYDAAVLKSSFQDWHQPIALIHDCLKVLPNDMDKAKERIKHGSVHDIYFSSNPCQTKISRIG